MTTFATRRFYTRPGKINNASGDFVCGHCGTFVSVNVALSGVGNRNHCPYCLSSRHMDQFEPGDRLSACKARMEPIGLTFKRTAKKYTGHHQGELMLVHLCDDCGKVSINRIAADDSIEEILSVLERSAGLAADTRDLLDRNGVTLLDPAQADLVHQCLFGVNYAGAPRR
jgi:predicted RNA-binding Zn-ribbon protein involved in translation (DUF1610 family)